MKKAVLIVLDSAGAGELPDAAKYLDQGANTLGHVVEKARIRLPNMEKIGLGYIGSTGLPRDSEACGLSGRLAEKSPGKDTTTGHWEIAGLRLERPFPTFPEGFPQEVILKFESAIDTKTLGNFAASGTEILDLLGEEHLKTGFPIVYTSADSVFQIAANEAVIPLARLYEMCEIARHILTDKYAVGRVIARPFIGSRAGAFKRTSGRRDFSFVPMKNTLLDDLKRAGCSVLGVGKIEDIFAHRGLTGSIHAAGNAACIEATLHFLEQEFNGLLFVNLVDFDMIYGHRRDVKGYAQALQAFDRALLDIQGKLGSDDLLIITADHGCDPAHTGTDHTREYAPLLVWRRGMKGHLDLGDRETFADIAATISEFFNLPERYDAQSFLQEAGG